MANRRRGSKQLALPLGRGQRKLRKRSARTSAALTRRPNVVHRPRPAHEGRSPVHVTMRTVKGLPSLRNQVVHAGLKSVFSRQLRRDYGPFFQLVQFTIQVDHLHLIVEAQAPTAQQIEAAPRLLSKRVAAGLDTKERDMLRRGIAGIAISFARFLNRLLGRKGSVWADRHHRRELTTPREVRNALVYVLQNYRRHGAIAIGDGATDPFSSGTAFDGWFARRYATWDEVDPWRRPSRTWLLAEGWLRAGGRIMARDVPPPARDAIQNGYRGSPAPF